MSMSSRERLLAAFDRKSPDRLPATTHHLQSYFLKKYMDGCSEMEFFDHFGLDAIRWVFDCKPNPSPDWELIETSVEHPEYETKQIIIRTPKGDLTNTLHWNEYTYWWSDHFIKEKKDIELIAEFWPTAECDVDAVNKAADELGERGIVRGFVALFDYTGQPGCWQDAACLYGIEKLIMATYDDPDWVHELLLIIMKHKAHYIRSLKGARYDIIELGGGDASSTVISPQLFEDFVAPYDQPLIVLAHEMGQRVAYHTCGGMMPILENIANMEPDAMETFTPPSMGADVDLAEAKRRIGDRVCMIGGFDQGHYFSDCSPEETRKEVRRCFEAAGAGGGYVLCPSDHFFDSEPELIMAFAEEARNCTYD